jgi:hypothetical protein
MNSFLILNFKKKNVILILYMEIIIKKKHLFNKKLVWNNGNKLLIKYLYLFGKRIY